MYCPEGHKIKQATVAQLVEYDLAKVGVAGSNPVCRFRENRISENITYPIFLVVFLSET